MAVGLSAPEVLLPVAGVRLAAVPAGIRYRNRDDLVLMELAEGSRVAATFTRNAFCAAPVTVAKRHLDEQAVRYLLINAGNANAGTGERGLEDALASCARVAEGGGCDASAVLPFSTGVIGENLNMAAMTAGIDKAFDALAEDNWMSAAKAIMTTDTVAKGVSRQLEIDGRTVTITGIAKGSGMIRPDMATLLAYVATDACVEQQTLDKLTRRAVDASFNSITVDGDTSTNDACVLVATGAAGNAELSEASDHYGLFAEAVYEVMVLLAQAIIRDGEGATKFITVAVEGGRDVAECRQVAYTVAHSPLVKTAFFASDPNWGRILAAVGRAGLEALDLDAIRIWLDEVCIVSNGGRDQDYEEEKGQRVMDREEITVRIELGRGQAKATVWTSDLSHEYVRINAEYRS